jgi:hypothetical protein
MSKAYKQLGKVADGRIRKNWPTAPPFGPMRTRHSRSKGFVNPFERSTEPLHPNETAVQFLRRKGLLEAGGDTLAAHGLQRGPGGKLWDLDGQPIKHGKIFVRVSCFKHALLQCLMHVPEFIHYLSRPERCSDWRCHDPKDKKGLFRCVYCALRDLARHYWTTTDVDFQQEKLMAVREAMELHPGRNFGDPNNGTYLALTPGRQHDSHEYFMASCLTVANMC